MSDTQRKKAAPADDDRNLVLVDDDFNEADLDDKIWLYWERNRTAILAGVALVFTAGLGFIGYRSYREYRHEAIGAVYAGALTPESKLVFAETHRGHALAAFAALEAADLLYAKGDLGAAAKAYAAADSYARQAEGGAPVVASRAPAVAAAICEIRAGAVKAGLDKLVALETDADAAKPAKLHALFVRAEHACGEKNFAEAARLLTRFDELARKDPVATEWASPTSPRALLSRLFPEIAEAKPAAPVAPAAK